MVVQVLADNVILRKRLRLWAMALLLVIAISCAYAVTQQINRTGNARLGGHSTSVHSIIPGPEGMQYIQSGNINLEGRNRHFQQIYVTTAPGTTSHLAKVLAAHIYHQILNGGWPHAMTAYVKSSLPSGNMYIYKAMHGPAGKFVWVAAMRHGQKISLISYSGIDMDLPLDEQEFDSLLQLWVEPSGIH